MPAAKTSIQYLAGASKISLESFELTRLNQIANLRKELRQVMEEWIEAEVEARFARWVLENRNDAPRSIVPFPDSSAESPVVFAEQRSVPVSAGLPRTIVKQTVSPRLGVASAKRSVPVRAALSRKIYNSR